MNGGKAKRDTGDALVRKVYNPLANRGFIQIGELTGWNLRRNTHPRVLIEGVEITEAVFRKEFINSEAAPAAEDPFFTREWSGRTAGAAMEAMRLGGGPIALRRCSLRNHRVRLECLEIRHK